MVGCIGNKRTRYTHPRIRAQAQAIRNQIFVTREKSEYFVDWVSGDGRLVPGPAGLGNADHVRTAVEQRGAQ